jgi:hypothetical protein
MNHSYQIYTAILISLCASIACHAQEKEQDHFSIFNPVPTVLMREMETDRPDVTESPITVDAGHFQLETDFIQWERVQTETVQTHTLLINQMNLKIGITANTAIQIGFQTYGIKNEKEIESGTDEINQGHGDLTLRIKQNLIGNNKGDFALALLPYLRLPISTFDDSRLEAGLIVPMSYRLPGKWKLGFQMELDRLKDQSQPTMHTEFLQTLTISHPIVKGMDGIAETYYTYDFKAHQFSNFINAAIQVEIIKDFKLDAGLNYGLQHTADKHYFVGASYRL